MAKSTLHMYYHTGTAPQDVEIKSYATRENLQRGLENLGFATHRHVIVRTLEGRYTAIFPASNFSEGGYIGLYSQHGFMTLG